MIIHNIENNRIKTILQYSMPCIISMLLSTLITFTDGVFTGNCVGENALAAINIGLPILYFYLGLGLCFGVGGSVITGILSGASKNEESNRVFSQTIVTVTIISLLCSFLLNFLFNDVVSFLRVNSDVITYFNNYYKLMIYAYPLLVLSTVLGMFIRTDGKPIFCMVISILGVALNALLDYIFMVNLDMGIKGSALATMIVQLFTLLISLLYFIKLYNKIHFVNFNFNFEIFKQTLLNGFSEFIGEMASAISMFGFNYMLLKYVGTAGVIAFSVLGYTVYGFSMLVIGFGQGISPLISISFGAKRKDIATDLKNITIRIITFIGFFIGMFLILFSKQYAQIFAVKVEVSQMIANGFIFFIFSFLLMGYNVIGSMYFTSIGDAKSSALISFLRGIFLLLLFIFTLPRLLGMTGIWLCTPLTEILTVSVTLYLIKKDSLNER